jgi:anti-sigma regulatory factor (Ser/Thr protein kinase)
MTKSRTFDCDPSAVTAARRFVREALSGSSQQVIDAAELMTSELTSNCVRHAETAFEVGVRTGGDVRVEVRDRGGGSPRPLSPTPEEPSGRGLLIVEAMSDSWGVLRHAKGKTVWFTVAAPDAAAVGPGHAGLARR